MRQASDLKCAGEESSGRETIGPSKDRGCVTEGVRPTTTHRTSYYYQCSSSTTFSTSTRPAMSNLSSTSSSVTATPSNVKATQSYPSQPPGTPTGKSPSRIPVTPAVLRSIFASSRTTLEERSLSRVAFFRCVISVFVESGYRHNCCDHNPAGSPGSCSVVSRSVSQLREDEE